MNNKSLDSPGLDHLVQLVTFKIEDEEFGVDILRVQEIIRMMPIGTITFKHREGR